MALFRMRRPDGRELAAIFAGGNVGAVLRVALAEAAAPAPGGWPWPTFAATIGWSPPSAPPAPTCWRAASALPTRSLDLQPKVAQAPAMRTAQQPSCGVGAAGQHPGKHSHAVHLPTLRDRDPDDGRRRGGPRCAPLAPPRLPVGGVVNAWTQPEGATPGSGIGRQASAPAEPDDAGPAPLAAPLLDVGLLAKPFRGRGGAAGSTGVAAARSPGASGPGMAAATAVPRRHCGPPPPILPTAAPPGS